MDLESVICEIDVTEKNKYHMIWITCDIWKKNYKWTNITQQKCVIDTEKKDEMGLRDGWNRWRGTKFHLQNKWVMKMKVHGLNKSNNNALSSYDD